MRQDRDVFTNFVKRMLSGVDALNGGMSQNSFCASTEDSSK